MKRIDERDVIFSRLLYGPQTAAYADYYKDKPEQREIDDAFRTRPPFGDAGAAFFDPINAPISDACFAFLAALRGFVDGKVSASRTEASPEVFTRRVKGLAGYYNAKLVGIAPTDPDFYYSHKGRPLGAYGEPVELAHKYAIAFAVEMDRDMIFRSPQQAESVAVTKGYIDAAIIGMVLSHYIRALGYEARNHMDGSYLVVAPLVAQAAGLGEIGRSGLLITKEYGPRVRLGVVTTNLPLVMDEKKDFGIAGLCEVCKKCSTFCPAKAIPSGGRTDYGGCPGWKIDSDKCFANWQRIGTDCGICLAACPLSDDIPTELRDGLTTSPDSRAALLAYCDEKRRGRPYVSGNPDWMT